MRRSAIPPPWKRAAPPAAATPYAGGCGAQESGSSETRHAIYLRGDDGITFQESAGNEDGSELTSNFYIRPGEYFYLDTANDQWVRTDLQEGLDVRPYSLSAATSSVSSSQIRRIHKTTVDGKDAFEVIYNRQWLMSSYQGQSTDEPLTGSVIYILATDGDTTYVEETRQTLNVRVTDSEGNTSTQISEDINQLINGYHRGRRRRAAGARRFLCPEYRGQLHRVHRP